MILDYRHYLLLLPGISTFEAQLSRECVGLKMLRPILRTLRAGMRPILFYGTNVSDNNCKARVSLDGPTVVGA